MGRTITWLHISDLHARRRDGWDSSRVIDTMSKDLKSLQASEGLVPDLIFFTGDVAFGRSNGEQLIDQYQIARTFFETVRNSFTPAVPLRSLYVVPGNHDVDRSEISPSETAWLRDSRRDAQEILSAMRDETKQWRAWIERLTAYRNFLTSYGLLHLTPADPHLIWADARDLSDIRVGVIGLNSAWSCADDQDKGRLWCGIDWQIAKLKERMGATEMCFALIHHPSNWFVGAEDPLTSRRLLQEAEIVLHGHEHQEWLNIGHDGRMTISSGACYDSSWMANGYNLGRIDCDTREVTVWLRQWDRIGQGWIPRDIAGQTESGIRRLTNISWLNSLGRGRSDATQLDLGDPKSGQKKGPSAEHFTRRFCQHVIEQHDVLELFGCNIPRELQKHQLSVAYISLDLSTNDRAVSPILEKMLDWPAGRSDSEPRRHRPLLFDDISLNHVSKTGTPDKLVAPARKSDATTEDGNIIAFSFEEVLARMVSDANRLMILGPAGAGKSTLLRWCAINAAKFILQGGNRSHVASNAGTTPQESDGVTSVDTRSSWQSKVPILIRLRDCPDGRLPAAEDLPRFLAKHLPSAPNHWVTDLLDAGEALVLLDGVDEVHRDQRAVLATEIEELVKTFPKCTYIVTTRPGAVEDGWLARMQFIEAHVEPMERDDRDEFIEKWYRSAALELRHRPRAGEDLTRTATNLKVELNDQPELGLLASNPLLCAMICALYRERQERLPETPAELCEALVQMLLHRRERETPGLQDDHFLTSWRGLLYPQKKGLLAELAWYMVKSEQSSVMMEPARKIVAEVLSSTPGRSSEDAAEVLQALIERSGLLRPAGDDGLDFLHNTLKEYLAAGRIVEDGKWEFLAERSEDPLWQPVILFALALAPEPFSSGVVRNLLGRLGKEEPRRSGNLSRGERAVLARMNARRFFLARCRSAARRLAGDLSAEVDQLSERLFPPNYVAEVEALAQLGPRILLHSGASLLDPDWWQKQDVRMAARCLRLLRRIGGPRAAAGLLAVKTLPSYSSQLTGEWMIACAELSDTPPPWPFRCFGQVEVSNTHVRDLRPLTTYRSDEHPLQIFRAEFTRISDLRPLVQFKELAGLYLQGTLVRDLYPLADLTNLVTLVLDRTHVSDLSPLSNLTNLRRLDLDYSDVSDISSLSNLTKLDTLYLQGSAVKDFSPLSTLESLTHLFLRGSDLRDIGPLGGLSGLKALQLTNTFVDNIEAVSNLPKLESLYLDGSSVTDLTPLFPLEGLEYLSLSSDFPEANLNHFRRARPAVQVQLVPRVHFNF